MIKFLSFKNDYYSYDGLIFHQHADSIHGHSHIPLANVNGSPLAVGGYHGNGYNRKAETFDITTNAWTEVADYPYLD